MTTDSFTTAARAKAEQDWGTTVRAQRPAFIAGALWARDRLAAQGPQVTINREKGKPATCEVRQGGVLIFSGRDHSADLLVAAQEPTNAEVEALVDSLNWAIRGTTDGDLIDQDSDIPAGEVLRLIREGARAALTAARKARA